MSLIQIESIPSKEIIQGLHFRFVHSQNMTVSFVHIEEGANLPEHAHPHEQITIMRKGKLKLVLGGEPHILEPGSVLIIPGNVPHSAQALTECEVMDIFSPVREDFQ